MIKNIQAQYLELIFIDFICLSQINAIKIQITMDINTNRVFSISAIILGLYIIFTYLWGSNITVKEKVSKSKIREDFHVGCYLNDHNLTHSSRLSFRVDEIKSQSFKKLYNSDSSLIPNDYLQKKGIEVAQNFEKFIQSYNVVRARTLSNIELSRALSKAKQQFQNCVQELNGQSSFSERDCTDDWESYKNCEGDLSNLKRDLDVSLNQKDGITQKLKKLLDRGVQPIPVAGPKSDFEKQFKRKYAQLQTKQRNLQGEVRRLSLKITQDQYHLDILENNTYHSIKIYNSCALHRNQYKLCEELGVEVRSLGHGSIQNLESKIKKKQAALLKMNETLKGDPDSHQLKVFVEKSFLEFKKLMKLFVETKAKMIRHCGCSESDQIQLRQEMEKNKKEKQGKQRQIRQNRQIQLEKIGELDRVREQMKKLQDELQIKIHKLSSQNPVINNDAILKLGQLQRQSESNSKVIKELQDKFKILDGKCKQIKSRLTQNVKGVSKINDCLNSFHYYSEIKKKYEKQAPKQIKMDAILKRKLFKSVEQFRV